MRKSWIKVYGIRFSIALFLLMGLCLIVLYLLRWIMIDELTFTFMVGIISGLGCVVNRCVLYYANVKKEVGKMANAYERHDISDESWAKIELLLPGRKGTWGGNARDNRQFINAVFWILRTGAPWRDLPPSYGD